MFALDPSIDAGSLAQQFAERRRLQIAPFLDEGSASRLRDHLLARHDWRLILNAGEKVFEIARDDFEVMDRAAIAKLEALVADSARDRFQYRFESIRVPDEADARTRAGTLLDEFALFLSSEPVVSLFRQISGADDIGFADAQATCYRAGHFLTCHDDDVSGKNRRAAYVFSMTPSWRPEWGGLLMFHGEDGNIEEAFTPADNVLSLFAVPQKHSVSFVAPYVSEPRLSVTGWLRR